MRTFRAYLPTDCIDFSEVYQLPLQEGHHLAKVLRLQEGDLVEIFNGKGQRYEAKLVNVGKHVSVRLLQQKPSNTQSPLALQLMVSIGKGDKMDWIIQKATELGVSKIIPLVTSRCEVRLPKERMAKKIEHWREISVQACVQCGQDNLPEITDAYDLMQVLPLIEQGEKWLLHPAENTLRLKDILLQSANIAAATLLIGPEGGFDEKEVTLAIRYGFRLASLGPRILRMESAAIASLALVQGLIGDL
ncbi:MAG: ribosomal methyltransferase RsmE [Gammaproteobacteria bacterium]|jgi:16S rRNA (uracil1498-N3)-methyltransferase|nr:ribosomal methyltransferase RsmE [Gammaproteobacteria bacterium]